MYNIFDFWDILIAIILLIFSSQIALFKYPERIKNCMVTLNKLKVLKGDLSTSGVTNKSYSEYYNITQNIDFLFSRSDFYLSCKNYDKKHSTNEIDLHFSKTEIFFISVRIILENTLYFLLILLPIAMYLCLMLF